MEDKKPDNNNHYISWGIFLLLIVILFATNPNESQFKNFLKEDFIAKSSSDDERVLARLFGGTVASLSALATEKKEYYIFSIYNIEDGHDSKSYLGIANHFFKLS